MTNIYLKDAIEKNWRSQNFFFLNLENLTTGQFWGTPTHVGSIELQNFLLQLKDQRSESKTVCGFSIVLILKGIWRFKVKESR